MLLGLEAEAAAAARRCARRAARCCRAACRSAPAPAPAGSAPPRRSARRSSASSCFVVVHRALRVGELRSSRCWRSASHATSCDVVVGGRLERVVADAGVQRRARTASPAASPRAASSRRGRRRWACGTPAARARSTARSQRCCQAGRARRGRGAHRLLERVAAGRARSQMRAELGAARRRRSASRTASVVARMSSAEPAAARHDVDRAVRHLQHAHRADQVRHRARRAARANSASSATALRGVAPAVHRRRAGVAGHADRPRRGSADAAVDRRHDAERQVELVQHRPLLDVDLDEAEIVGRVALGS